jgi:DNA-binding NtrC family response regulator
MPSAGQHILVIDDEDAIVSIVAAYLREYRVSACIDVEDALDIVAREELDLLIVDFVMPKMSGDELVRRAREIRPVLPVLVITGYAAAVQTIGLQNVRILEKPFSRSELLEAIALAQAQEADVG